MRGKAIAISKRSNDNREIEFDGHRRSTKHEGAKLQTHLKVRTALAWIRRAFVGLKTGPAEHVLQSLGRARHESSLWIAWEEGRARQDSRQYVVPASVSLHRRLRTKAHAQASNRITLTIHTEPARSLSTSLSTCSPERSLPNFPNKSCMRPHP